jgi:DNA-binding XRE family transcriptional regulator
MIINNLSKILDERGIKQIWLCAKADISQTTLSNCLNDRHSVSLIVALKIANALELRVEDIWQLRK